MSSITVATMPTQVITGPSSQTASTSITTTTASTPAPESTPTPASTPALASTSIPPKKKAEGTKAPVDLPKMLSAAPPNLEIRKATLQEAKILTVNKIECHRGFPSKGQYPTDSGGTIIKIFIPASYLIFHVVINTANHSLKGTLTTPIEGNLKTGNYKFTGVIKTGGESIKFSELTPDIKDQLTSCFKAKLTEALLTPGNEYRTGEKMVKSLTASLNELTA